MSEGKRIGPTVRLQLSCYGCKYERSESYAVQGDSGLDVYCTHPESGCASEGGAHVGDTRWDTPDWCPERDRALKEARHASP